MNIFSRKKAAKKEKNADIKPRGAIEKISLYRSWLPKWIRGDYTLRNSELLFSATSRIANALSAMPVQLYRGTTPVYNAKNDLVSYAPNSSMTASGFFKTMEACRCTYGNNYALKIVDQNFQTIRLDILDPDRVKPVLDSGSNELYYKIQPEGGKAYFVHNFYMISVPFISTNGYEGVNPVSVLFDTLSYSENIQKFSIEQLEKGINAAVVLEAPANLGVDQKKSMLQDFTQVYKETGGNILMLESGVTAKALNLSPVDTKLFEVEKITRGKVAMVYNLPPHLLGDYSDASFSTMEQQMLEFLTLTMLPIVTAYENELNKKLLTAEEYRRKYRFKFNMNAILRADANTQANVNFKAIRSGYKLINEVRAEYGDPGIKNGDKALVSKDLITLDSLISMIQKGGANEQNLENNDTGQTTGGSGERYRADQSA